MKTPTFLQICCFLLFATAFASNIDKIVLEKLEHAYFEGQKDAINGDIRIEKYNDSCYRWIRSPWDNDREPVFHPSLKCN